MLETSHYKHTFILKKHFSTSKTLLKKLLEVVTYLQSFVNKTKTAESLCGAIFLTLFAKPQWTLIRCNDTFNDNNFICEEKVAYSLEDSRVMKRKSYWCIAGYVYIADYCHTIKETFHVVVPFYKFAANEVGIQYYITSWSISDPTRNTILLQQSGEKYLCLSSNAFDYQQVQRWIKSICGKLLPNVTFITRKFVHTKSVCNPAAQHRCSDDTCILSTYVCDGYDDCSDHSDETACHDICKYTNTSDSTELSSNVKDCARYCQRPACQCDTMYFQCKIGSCIPFDNRCDHIQHCHDGSDELRCHYNTPLVVNKRTVDSSYIEVNIIPCFDFRSLSLYEHQIATA